MTTYNVGYLVGSLAKASINRLLAKALVRLAPPELRFSEISFKDLPLYSYDHDAVYPPVARAFKQAIADSAASGKRTRRVGIVALARRLAIALWRYLEHGEIPDGAVLKPTGA